MFWFWSALTAAIFWGMDYAVIDHLMRRGISAYVLMATTSLINLLLFASVAFVKGDIGSAVEHIKAEPKLSFWMIGCVITYTVANTCIFWAIAGKNATIASLIEISYPFFVAIFAWLLFQQIQLTLSMVVGGVMVLGGIGIIYFGK
jgi:drug/metabolite transporter (DMT)-like permease